MASLFNALSRTPRVVGALILREMTTTYGRSPGGYLWVILEPLGGIAVLTLAFSFIMRTPPLGISFPIFYATGVLPYGCYQDIVSKTASAMRFSKQLLAYPAVTFMDAIIARMVLNGMTQLLLVYLIMGGLMLAFETRTVVDYPTVALAMMLAILLGAGVGVFNCLMFAFFPLWDRLWGIATRPLFLFSGIFFTYDSLSAQVQAIFWWNPLIHVIGLMRRGFYPDYAADYVSVPYVLAFAAIPGLAGLFFLRRYYRIILYEL